MKLRAPAKINPFLSVGAARGDGRHEIVSVMQAVSLYDTVSLSASDGFEIAVSPSGSVPADESNLAMPAARALAALQGVSAGVTIELTKRIPVAAGLGGGSADAAAVLVGCNALWETRASKKSLEKIGAGIGADVPFCVHGGTAAARGAGEDLSSLPCARALWWVLLISAGSLSTAAVYDEFDRLGGGSVGDPYEVADALARGDLSRLAGALRNDLESAAVSLGAPDARAALLGAGALGAVLSGSGPTWCGLATDEAHARAIAARLAGGGDRVEVVASLEHGPTIVEA